MSAPRSSHRFLFALLLFLILNQFFNHMKKSLLLVAGLLASVFVFGQSNFSSELKFNPAPSFKAKGNSSAQRVAMSSERLDSVTLLDGGVETLSIRCSYSVDNKVIYFTMDGDSAITVLDDDGVSIADTSYRSNGSPDMFRQYSYSQEGDLYEEKRYEWDGVDGWVFTEFVEFDYEKLNDSLVITKQEFDVIDSSLSVNKIVHVFDTQGRRTLQKEYDFDPIDSTWSEISYARIGIEYQQNGELVTMNYFERNSGVWEVVESFSLVVDPTSEVVSIFNFFPPYDAIPGKILELESNEEIEKALFYYSGGEGKVTSNDGSIVSSLEIFPNPTTSQLTISLEESFGPSSYQLMSLNGEILQEGKISNEANLNVSDLANGFYVVHLTNEKGERITHKFLKN